MRESLGKLKVNPLLVNQATAAVMTNWVKYSAPDELVS